MNKSKIFVYSLIGLVALACIIGFAVLMHSGVPFPHGV